MVLRTVHGAADFGVGRVGAPLVFDGLGNACGVTRDGPDDGFAFEVGREAEDGVAVDADARAGASADLIPAVLFFIGSVCFGKAAEIGNELRVTTTESLLLFLLLSSLDAGIVPFRVIPAEAWEGEEDSPGGPAPNGEEGPPDGAGPGGQR